MKTAKQIYQKWMEGGTSADDNEILYKQDCKDLRTAILSAMEEYANQFAPAIKEGEIEKQEVSKIELESLLLEFAENRENQKLNNNGKNFESIYNATTTKILNLFSSSQLKVSDEEIRLYYQSFDTMDAEEVSAAIHAAILMRDNPESFLTK